MTARLLNAAALCLLLLGSCVGPGVLYAQSPRLLLREFDPARTRLFFVAYESRGADGKLALRVRELEEPAVGTEARYDLPPGERKYDFPGGEGGARITVFADRRVQVFVHGDTPWTSLSEYRVVDNRVQPTRYARSEPLILLGVVVCLVLVGPAMRLVRRATARLGERRS